MAPVWVVDIQALLQLVMVLLEMMRHWHGALVQACAHWRQFHCHVAQTDRAGVLVACGCVGASCNCRHQHRAIASGIGVYFLCLLIWNGGI